MKNFSVFAMVTLAAVFCMRQGYSQSTLAPLYLFTSGTGSITPLQDGQFLTVGESYDITAIPDSGFMFSSWQPVNVFVFNNYFTDISGNLVTNSSTVASPFPSYTETSSLTFTMQPVQIVVNTGVELITENSGWQANFVPVPEPSNAALMASGFTIAVLLQRKRLKTTVLPNNSPEPPPIADSVPHSRLTVIAARLSFCR
jgi:hypothetical protein